jgi:SAM-dependent methyltransferase
VSATTDETGGATVRAPRDTARLFNDVAGLYDRLTRSLDAPEASINRWLAKHLGSGRRALDVGCGVGRYSIMLADRYDDVVGIDAAPAMIEIAERERSRSNIRYQARDVLSLAPERDGCFNLVLAINCILHVGPPELVLGHLRRLVAKGGTMLVVEPVRPPTWRSQGWQVDLAFRAARGVWDMTGDMDDVAATLQLMLSTTWFEVNQISVPLTREDFFREYSAALPGAALKEEDDLLGLEFFTASWRAVDDSLK